MKKSGKVSVEVFNDVIADEIQKQLNSLENPVTASTLQRFFKTGPGEYGEGDLFRGIRVPSLRKLAKRYQNIPLSDAKQFLMSRFHEDRLLALFILVRIYIGSDDAAKTRIYKLYLDNTRFINNWDLVDGSAEHIVGNFLMDKNKQPLYRLARSNMLWERRIAIMSTFHFIKRGVFDETFTIAKMLITDTEDLIHKAVGWMLREVGKRDLRAEENFLNTCYTQMPRTMLRYAIEKFSEPKRLGYLRGEI